jgi:hypothetical protein
VIKTLLPAMTSIVRIENFLSISLFSKISAAEESEESHLITISPFISFYLIYPLLIQNKIRSIPIVLISANTIQGNAYVNAIYIYKYISKILIEKHTRKILLFIRFMENVMNYITAGLFA